jgi:hypothetical protein
MNKSVQHGRVILDMTRLEFEALTNCFAEGWSYLSTLEPKNGELEYSRTKEGHAAKRVAENLEG